MRVSHACALVLVTLLAACGGSTESTPTADTGLDALADLGLDAPSDASSDGTPDVAADVTPDASVDAAADGASDASCAACLSSGLAWKMDGGRVQSIDQMSIAPCRAYGRSRFAVSDLVHPTLTCSADLAHCAASADAAGVVSIDAVVAAVAAPDVQAAFAKAPALYGVDTRPADGAVFHVELGGRALDVGDACPSPDAGSCAPIPAGVSALVALLQALDAQQLAGACSAFK